MEKVLIDIHEFKTLSQKMDFIISFINELNSNKNKKMDEFNKEYLTIKEAMEYTGLSYSWFNSRIRKGVFQTRKKGVKIKEILKKDIDELVKE